MPVVLAIIGGIVLAGVLTFSYACCRVAGESDDPSRIKKSTKNK